MKRFSYLLIVHLLVTAFSMGQSPQSFKYQAIARNADGAILINQPVSLVTSIIQGSISGPVLYSEVHTISTNAYGLISVDIGSSPVVVFGVFGDIDWGLDNYFLEVEIDPEGGSSYQYMGTTQLLSVPYALFAQHAGNAHWQKDATTVYYNDGGVGIGSSAIDPNSLLHLAFPYSDNFARLTLESPATNKAFGIMFTQPDAEWLIGQNLGNWGDGRFQIAAEGSNHWFTMLNNGNIGLTKIGFTTPFARLQVPQNGNIDASGTLDLTQSAIFIGLNETEGIAFDRDQIESIANELKINYLSPTNVNLAYGGGHVGVNVEVPHAPFHIGEGETVLFGSDTMGKANFYPDPKVMFLPSKGGAFRAGQLNADGSLPSGTGYNYWDHSKIGWASVAIGNNTRAVGVGSVAIGIRSDARNFGSVALGHLSQVKGNSGVAAGYYTRVDAFVSCAVGAGNVGGGSANSWVNTDPIFEVGNSIDTNNRSNAFTVMKNGRVGINHHNPQSMLDIEQPNQGPGNGVLLNLSGYGHWETSVDYASDFNFYFNNLLKSYITDTDGAYIQSSDRRLKYNIHQIEAVLPRVMELKPSAFQFTNNPSGSPISTGFIAQEVETLFPQQVREKNGIKGIAYSEFSVIAIKAIQEQQELIYQQQNKINDLEDRIKRLERLSFNSK